MSYTPDVHYPVIRQSNEVVDGILYTPDQLAQKRILDALLRIEARLTVLVASLSPDALNTGGTDV